MELGVLEGRGHVVPLPHGVVERALAATLDAPRAAGVEAEDRDVRERGEAERGLAVDVAVHHPAVGGQRVQADERRQRRALDGKRQLADQAQPVRRLQGQGFAAGRQDRVGADLVSGHGQQAIERALGPARADGNGDRATTEGRSWPVLSCRSGEDHSLGGTTRIFAALLCLITFATRIIVRYATPESAGLPVPSTMLLPRSSP